MKWLLIYSGLILTSLIAHSQKNIGIKKDTVFTLSYISVGLGSNMFYKQPMFRVIGTKFVYTLEDAWKFKGVKMAKPEILQTGHLRMSSIDSILQISKEVKGDSVYELKILMSGRIIYLQISSPQRKLKFELNNCFDSTAKKIIDILNGYIDDKHKKLSISHFTPTITEIL